MTETGKFEGELAALRRDIAAKAARLAAAYDRCCGAVPELVQDIVAYTARAAKYNPDWEAQPRVPGGNPGDGQWTDGGGLAR
ncbi:MAG: hypothetical protein GC131_09070 [Alphaproteobacteria bacterium]|nr:hypothetical protein [Alphaproteobacteria bacterium]